MFDDTNIVLGPVVDHFWSGIVELDLEIAVGD